jgi:hypothetical protein
MEIYYLRNTHTRTSLIYKKTTYYINYIFRRLGVFNETFRTTKRYMTKK